MTTLLMTGTIAPPADARSLAVRDVAGRVGHYREALAFNIGLLDRGVIRRLVFVENSGHGMAPFADLVEGASRSADIRLVSYDGLAPVGERRTRFFGECELLRYAGRELPELADDAGGPVFKVTGRYIVRNLEAILGSMRSVFDVALHCRNRPMRYVDFGLAGFRGSRMAEFLDRVLAWPGIEDHDERILRDMMDQGAFDGLTVLPRLARVPDFVGTRGRDGSSYDGLKYRMKYRLRTIAHRVAPQIWI